MRCEAGGRGPSCQGPADGRQCLVRGGGAHGVRGLGPVLPVQPPQSRSSTSRKRCLLFLIIPTVAQYLLQIIGDKVNIFHKRYTVLTKIFYSRCLTVINIIRRLSTSSSLMGEYSRDHKFVIFCLSNLLVRNIPNLLSRLYSFLVEGSTKFWVPYKLDNFLLFLHLVP